MFRGEPIEMDRNVAITYMQNIMGSNKAMGLVAQGDFQKWVSQSGENVRRKYFNGCWVMSPKGSTASKRMCFFVHENVVKKDSVQSSMNSLVSNRGFHSLCGSIARSGLGIFYCIPTGDPDIRNLDNLEWMLFRYQNENLVQINGEEFFAKWPGNGRVGRGAEWNSYVRNRYQNLDSEILESLVLNQVFFSSFVKRKMRKPVADPYDVDGFFVSYEGRILPIEIKEKFPFEAGKAKLLGIMHACMKGLIKTKQIV